MPLQQRAENEAQRRTEEAEKAGRDAEAEEAWRKAKEADKARKEAKCNIFTLLLRFSQFTKRTVTDINGVL